MKQYVKKVIDRHPWDRPMRRQKQSKVPKQSIERKGTRTATRMHADREMRKDLYSLS